MGSIVAVVVLLACCCGNLAEAYPRRSDDTLSNMWHVFRQIHESDVARRPYLAARRSSSPMVIEKTRIIPASEPKPPAPSTIITRIKTENVAEEEANTKAPKSALSSVWTLKMSGRRSEAESLEMANVQTERIDSVAVKQLTSTSPAPAGTPTLDLETSGKLQVAQAERLNQQSVVTAKANRSAVQGQRVPDQDSHAGIAFEKSPEGSGRRTQQTSSLKFWEVFRKRIPDRWSVFNKAAPAAAANESLLARSPHEDNQLMAESRTAIEQMKDDAVVATSTQLPEQAATVQRNESQQLDASVNEPSNKKRLTVRADNATFYSVASFVNGSLMFQRTESVDDIKYSQSLDDIEIYYPGIGSLMQNRPLRIVIHWSGVALADAGTDASETTDKLAELTPEPPTVTEWSEKAESTSPPTIVELATDASVVSEEIITPADFITEEDAEALTTTMPTSTTDDQLTTPLLKSSEGSVLTHSLTPTTTTMAEPSASARSFISVSSSSSSSSSSVSTSNGISYVSRVSSSHSSSNPGSVSLSTRTSTSSASKGNSTTGSASGSLDLIAPDNSTSIVSNATRSRVIQPARFWSIVSSRSAESLKPRTAEIAEILPLGFLKNRSMTASNKPTMAPLLIFMKGSSPIVLAASAESLDQFTTVKPQINKKNSNAAAAHKLASFKLKSPSFVFHPKANFSDPAVTFKVASHQTNLTSLILAHSAALISRKSASIAAASNGNSSDTMKSKPGARRMDHASPSSAGSPRAAPPGVHVIMATALADPPEFEFRDRSLDSAEDGRKYDAYWAVPTHGQLTETPNGYLAGSSPGVSSHVANQSRVVQLPTVPRFTCGRTTSLEEFVLTNPSYPEPDEDAGRCEFRLLVTSPTVCQVRVEFRDSRMLLPRHGSCLYQQMSVSGSLAVTPGPKFCGWNSDQHFYLELNERGERHVDINVHTKAAGYRYSYAIVVKQIDCHSPNELIAPKGCFQYYPSRTGEIKSFNFEGGQYWSEQNYKICIRTSQKTCTISMTSANGNFGLNELSRTPGRSTGKPAACHRDYLVIPRIRRADDENVEFSEEERVCGTKFANPHDDRTRPGVIIGPLAESDVYVMEFHAGTFRRYETRHFGPGFAINYAQIAECPANVKRRSR